MITGTSCSCSFGTGSATLRSPSPPAPARLRQAHLRMANLLCNKTFAVVPPANDPSRWLLLLPIAVSVCTSAVMIAAEGICARLYHRRFHSEDVPVVDVECVRKYVQDTALGEPGRVTADMENKLVKAAVALQNESNLPMCRGDEREHSNTMETDEAECWLVTSGVASTNEEAHQLMSQLIAMRVFLVITHGSISGERAIHDTRHASNVEVDHAIYEEWGNPLNAALSSIEPDPALIRMAPMMWHEGEYWLRRSGQTVEEQCCEAASPDFGRLEDGEKAFLARVVSLVVNEPGFMAPHYHLLSTYPRTFIGSDFINLMIKHNVAPGREEAVMLGNKLQNFGLLHHVTREHHFYELMDYSESGGQQEQFYELFACSSQIDNVLARLVQQCSLPASRAAFMAGTGLVESMRSGGDWGSGDVGLTGVQQLYDFLMTGSFFLSLLSVMTSQYVLFYVRRLPFNLQRSRFQARAGFVIRAVSQFFRCSGVLLVMAAALIPAVYYPGSKYVWLPLVGAVITLLVFLVAHCKLAACFAKAIVTPAREIVTLTDAESFQNDHLKWIEQTKELGELYSAKAIFVAGFGVGGVTRYKPYHEDDWQSVFYLGGATSALFCSLLAALLTTDLMLFMSQIAGDAEELTLRRKFLFSKLSFILLRVCGWLFYLSMFSLLVAFTFISTGCSLRCETACGEPSAQGCYRDLYLTNWIFGGIGMSAMLFMLFNAKKAYHKAQTVEKANLPSRAEEDFVIRRLRTRTNAVASQATICGGAMFFGLLTLNTGHMESCAKLYSQSWYPASELCRGHVLTGTKLFFAFSSGALVFGACATVLATVLDGMIIRIHDSSRRYIFAQQCRHDVVICSVFYATTLVCTAAAFSTFGYSKVQPASHWPLISASVGFVFVGAYETVITLFAFQSANKLVSTTNTTFFQDSTSETPELQIKTMTEEINSMAQRALMFALYCFVGLHAFAAPEQYPYAQLFLCAFGLSFGFGLSIALQSACFSFSAAGLKSGSANVYFARKMLPLIRFSYRKFELTVIFFFLGFAFLGFVKKNVMTWLFDEGHELIIPILLVGGIIGVGLVIHTVYQVGSVFLAVKEVKAFELPEGADVDVAAIEKLFEEISTMATFLTARNVFLEIDLRRVNMKAQGATIAMYLFLTASFVTGIWTIVLSLNLVIFSKAFVHEADHLWARRQALFASYCRLLQSRVFTLFNSSCFLWILGEGSSALTNLKEGDTWVGHLLWVAFALIAALYMWRRAREHKHKIDGKVRGADLVLAKVQASSKRWKVGINPLQSGGTTPEADPPAMLNDNDDEEIASLQMQLEVALRDADRAHEENRNLRVQVQLITRFYAGSGAEEAPKWNATHAKQPRVSRLGQRAMTQIPNELRSGTN